jgi:hypothetical protein
MTPEVEQTSRTPRFMRWETHLFAKSLTFVFCCSILIWWSQSMSAQIKDGEYPVSEAISLTIEMSALMTILTVVAWLSTARVRRSTTRIGRSLVAATGTLIILILYTSAVVAWRQHWTPGKGLTESAAFIPVLGHMNAAFFADYGWLGYLFVVAPLASLISGLITWLFYVPRKSNPHVAGS